jgi:hypothetical protein
LRGGNGARREIATLTMSACFEACAIAGTVSNAERSAVLALVAFNEAFNAMSTFFDAQLGNCALAGTARGLVPGRRDFIAPSQLKLQGVRRFKATNRSALKIPARIPRDSLCFRLRPAEFADDSERNGDDECVIPTDKLATVEHPAQAWPDGSTT